MHPQNSGDIRRLQEFHLWNLVGFPGETALAAARLIFGGVLDRHPGLRVILAHGGRYFPDQLSRRAVHDHGTQPRLGQQGRLGNLDDPGGASQGEGARGVMGVGCWVLGVGC
jgi:aminocarboxymuconate-semialdehyde decarboxylase